MTYAIVALTVSLLGALFACEDPVLPPYLAREVDSFRGWRRMLRIFWPGSGSGALFTILTMTLFLAAAFIGFRTFPRHFDRGARTGWLPSLPLAAAFLLDFAAAGLTSRPARCLAPRG